MINLLDLNAKNVKFSVKSSLGTYGTPAELAKFDSLSLEPSLDEQQIFGDGDLMTVLVNDKGFKGEIVVVSKEDAFEKAVGFKLDLDAGIGDIQQLGRAEIAIYFEREVQISGVQYTYKVWLLDVFVSKAKESLSQRKDAPTINTYAYPLIISGDLLQNNAGTADYNDANGNTIRVYRIVKKPTDTGYATFGDAVPTPKAAA